MCILFIKLLKVAKSNEFRFILASNRDEYFKRPAKVAHFWEEDDNIIGGRDMTENKEGGTWLAMSKKGKVGVLLNLNGEEARPDKLGRGFLVVDYLKEEASEKDYLARLTQDGDLYNKFHLVTAELGSTPALSHFSNGSSDTGRTEINDTIFAASNSRLATPLEKVKKGKERFERIVENYGSIDKKDMLVEELLSLLKWEEQHYPDNVMDSFQHIPIEYKQACSSIFVKMPNVFYGTRTHTIILVDSNGTADFYEWTLKEPIIPNEFNWHKTHHQFNLKNY